MSLIFGYDWEEIQAAQQGGTLGKTLPPLSDEAHVAQITKDIEMFGISVYDSVVKKYAITLPEGYELQGDIWRKV